jgi:hypothetical protein
MGDGGRVPLVTKAGMDRSGRAMIGWIGGWVGARTRTPPERSVRDELAAAVLTALDARNAFDALTADRRPEFPTITDEDVSDQGSYDAQNRPEASQPAPLAFVLVGLAGLVGLCAIYPVVVLWILSVASGGNALIWSPITVGVATTLSVVLALLADRLIPGRVAVLLIAFVPLAVWAVVSASAGGPS